jgi:hypothetical protein
MMKKAVADPEITDIVECDLMLFGRSSEGANGSKEAILAHPPHRESDLSVT